MRHRPCQCVWALEPAEARAGKPGMVCTAMPGGSTGTSSPDSSPSSPGISPTSSIDGDVDAGWEVAGTPTSLRADAPEFVLPSPTNVSPPSVVSTPPPKTGGSGSSKPEPHGSSVYIKHVSGSPTAKQQRRLLHNSFSRFGRIKSVQLARQPKSSAMINFAKASSAAAAVAEASSKNGVKCSGQRLTVEFSRPKATALPTVAARAPFKATRSDGNSTSVHVDREDGTGYSNPHSAPTAVELASAAVSLSSPTAASPTDGAAQQLVVPEEADEADLLASAICSGAWWEDEAAIGTDPEGNNLRCSSQGDEASPNAGLPGLSPAGAPSPAGSHGSPTAVLWSPTVIPTVAGGHCTALHLQF